MPVSIGGVDVVASIIDLEFRVLVLEQITDGLIKKSGVSISPLEIESARSVALKILNEKHPGMGIGLKGAGND
jgi:hypothetical protein